jgi:hypothetical protein
MSEDKNTKNMLEEPAESKLYPIKKIKNLYTTLQNLLNEVDSDCPVEYRTKHLKTAMEDADEILLTWIKEKNERR